MTLLDKILDVLVPRFVTDNIFVMVINKKVEVMCHECEYEEFMISTSFEHRTKMRRAVSSGFNFFGAMLFAKVTAELTEEEFNQVS